MAPTLLKDPDYTKGPSIDQGDPLPHRVCIPWDLKGYVCSGMRLMTMPLSGVLPNLSSWALPPWCIVCPILPPHANSLFWFYSLFALVPMETSGQRGSHFWSLKYNRWQLPFFSNRAQAQAAAAGICYSNPHSSHVCQPHPSTSLSQESGLIAQQGIRTLQLSFSANISSCDLWPKFI